jgi:hypothetical protein
VRALAAVAGVEPEDEVADAVRAGFAGAGLRGRRARGHDGFMRHMAEQFFTHQWGDQRVLFLHVTLVLVAEHAERGIVGVVVAYPSIGVVRQVMQHGRRVGADPGPIVLTAAMALVRVKALSVAEGLRRQGVGGALVKRRRPVYTHCDYMIMYGQMPPTPGLDGFHRRHGFKGAGPGRGFRPVGGLRRPGRCPTGRRRTHLPLRPVAEPTVPTSVRPGPRREAGRSTTGRYDPGTLALDEGHLGVLLAKGPDTPRRAAATCSVPERGIRRTDIAGAGRFRPRAVAAMVASPAMISNPAEEGFWNRVPRPGIPSGLPGSGRYLVAVRVF